MQKQIHAAIANRGTMARQHPHADRGNDLYETPRVAIEALLDHFDGNIPARIWEPAVGKGAIADVLSERGYQWFGSDIMDYGTGHCHICHDFTLPARITPKLAGGKAEGIITNPPFKIATKFAERAVETGLPFVALLLRLQFLEGVERGRGLFAKTPPQRVLVFSKRLPMMHRDGWQGPKATSSTAYAWFVWNGPRPNPLASSTVVRWI